MPYAYTYKPGRCLALTMINDELHKSRMALGIWFKL